MTGPSMSAGLSSSGQLSDLGWWNAEVTVEWSCADLLSGVATCAEPTTVGEGADQSVTGTSTDNVGNSTTTEHGGINVDLTAPSTEITTADGAIVTYAGGSLLFPTQVTGTATDALSGVAAVLVAFESTLPGGTTSYRWVTPVCASGPQSCTWAVDRPEAPGPYKVTAYALDKAGNYDLDPPSIDITVV